MTTEQSDWLDDERAGRHAPKVLHGHPTEEEIAEARKDAPFGVLIVPTEELGPYFGAERPRIRDVTGYDADTMGLVYGAFEKAGIPDYTARDIVGDMQNAGILFRERVTEPTPEPYWVQRDAIDGDHTHYTREARDQCAAGDHKYAKLLDDAAEREKLRELIDRPQGEMPYFDGTDPEGKPVSGTWTGETTMAEEPIENRLRRAWLNGFRDGVERASYAATESTGRWDY